MDCMDGMAQFPDGFFDLAVVDPPYGRKEHGGKNRGKLVTQKSGTKIFVKDGGYAKKEWDFKPTTEEYFRELERVSKNQIVWGVNYLQYILGPGRIVWDKCNGASDQSDCEIAYNSMTTRVDLFRYMWAGMMQGKSITEGHIQQGNKAKNEIRIHPTQKPVALYTWIFQNYEKKDIKSWIPTWGAGAAALRPMMQGWNLSDLKRTKTTLGRRKNALRHTPDNAVFSARNRKTPARASDGLRRGTPRRVHSWDTTYCTTLRGHIQEGNNARRRVSGLYGIVT